jgi:L-iditol 2-dehydrogenase
MKAVVLRGVHELDVKEVPRPKVGPDEVLIRVESCGVCPTDIRKYYGESSCRMPIILGHEIGGTVAELGREVTGIEEGDKVSVMPDIPCGHCFYCYQNKFNLCLNLKSVGYGTDTITPIDGGYAEYVKVPASIVLELPRSMRMDDATYIEPLACVMRTMQRAKLDVGDSVLVIGDGRMGLLHLQAFKTAGVGKVFVSGVIEDRLELALSLGADTAINVAKQDLKKVIDRETGGLGVSAVVDTVGNIQATKSGFEVLQTGGSLILFASSPKGSAALEFDSNRIHYGEYIITGSYGNGSKMDFGRARDLISRGEVEVRKLTTETLPLVDTVKGFDDVRERRSIRTIIHPPSA